MTTRLSVNLSTNKPLLAGGFFIPPRWDDLYEYPAITLNIQGDTKMILTLYESPDEGNISSQTEYTIDANMPLNLQWNLNARYFKLKLVNSDLQNAQTTLNLQVIYSNIRISTPINSGQFKIWNNKTLSLPDNSATFNSNFKNQLFTFYGNSSEIINLVVQYSNDGIQYYDSQTVYTMASAGDFGFSVSAVCRYIRLRATQPTTITAYINYK